MLNRLSAASGNASGHNVRGQHEKNAENKKNKENKKNEKNEKSEKNQKTKKSDNPGNKKKSRGNHTHGSGHHSQASDASLSWRERLIRYLSSPERPRAAAWDAVGQGNRLRSWTTSSTAINPLLLQHLETLRNRSRDTVRKNPYAASIINTLITNGIGTGIKPHAKAADVPFRRSLQRLWANWVDEADSDGNTSFYGLQARVLRSMIEAGECLVRFQVQRPDADLHVPLQLQVLEGEQLDVSQDRALSNGGRIQGGIEFNRRGRRVAYYVYPHHPLEEVRHNQSVRVLAREILHLYRMDRPGQIRGEPWLSGVLLKLHELDQYEDAELLRKKTAAMFAGFITRLDPDGNFLGEGGANGSGVAMAQVEPGTLQLLDPGEDVKFSAPADVGGHYLDFIRQQLRAVAVGMGITYEQLSGDLSEVNYSSIRAGLIEFRRHCAMLQHHIVVFQLCRPVWQRWIALALLSNAITLPTDRTDYDAVQWIPQGFDWVDPLKDQQAQRIAVRNGFKSRTQVVSELGHDIDAMDEAIYRDHERAQSLDLPFDSHVRIQDEVMRHEPS